MLHIVIHRIHVLNQFPKLVDSKYLFIILEKKTLHLMEKKRRF